MILPGEKQKEGRHSEVILCSPSVQLRPPPPSLLPVVFGAMWFPAESSAGDAAD